MADTERWRATATKIADETLFPSALAVDRGEKSPRENLDLLAEVCSRTEAKVVASGGISSLDDLRALRELVSAGVEGAIVGKALYAGAFTLAEALDVAGD